MSVRANGRATGSAASACRIRPKRYVFFDIGTGTERFEVKAAPDGSLPVDQAASLIAIHCLVRGRNPRDFGVAVMPEENLLERLVPMATRLMEACTESRLSMSLSQRQQQVLRALLQDASNKEIAAKLNLSVRTVKFHISSLFEKFQVKSRFSLMRKAADTLLPEESSGAEVATFDRMRPVAVQHGQPVQVRNLVPKQFLRVVAGRQRASR